MEQEIDRMLVEFERPSPFYVHRKSIMALSVFVLLASIFVDYSGLTRGTFATTFLTVAYVISSMMILVMIMFLAGGMKK